MNKFINLIGLKSPEILNVFMTLCLLTLTSSASLVAQSGSPATSKAGKQTMTTEQLTKEAEVIVVGKVGRIVSEWTNDHSRIQTRVTVVVDQTIKGDAPGKSIEVITPGGEVEGVGEWYSHSVRFAREEDIVLFAKLEKNGHYGVAGGESGKFSINKDEHTGAKIIPNVGTLDEFTSKIKKSVKSTDNGTVRQ